MILRTYVHYHYSVSGNGNFHNKLKQKARCNKYDTNENKYMQIRIFFLLEGSINTCSNKVHHYVDVTL